MKTIIGVSNFSFHTFNFSSFNELETQFNGLKSLKSVYNQKKVSLAVANDITKNKSFGLSIDEQMSNFAFGKDRGAITNFKMRLDRSFLRGFDRSFTNDELKEKAKTKPCIIHKENTILYTPVPTLFLAGYSSFNTSIDFCNHYEYILGHFPIDNESYYDKVTSYFDNLTYHEDCKSTLDRVNDGFCNYTVAFTKCLKALSESSPTTTVSMHKKLSDIASKAKYNCTVEGKSHKNFKFDFNHNQKEYLALDCQFHLKPSDRNTKGNGSFHQKRVYFGFIPINDTEWEIAVAAMGPHITKHNSQDRFAPLVVKRKKVRRKGNS